jgi:hypothetical protein
MLFASSCISFDKKIEGNGKTTTEIRNVDKASKMKLIGDFDVVLSQGPLNIKVEADENLLPYILTVQENGWLEIRTKDKVDLKSSESIKVYVTTPQIDAIKIIGSGDVTSSGKFSSKDKMTLEVTGSGDLEIAVNTPEVEAEINGSGNLLISGETKDLKVDVSGSGNYKGADLKAENVKVEVAGSGDAFVFADESLKVDVAGSGGVKYKGNPSVKTNISGSGTVAKAE